MSSPTASPRLLTCPVCGTPVPDRARGAGSSQPCSRCGLPAVGQAGLVVARIGATLAELGRDRDALLATLRTLTAPAPPAAGAVPPQPVRPPAPTWTPAPAWFPPATWTPSRPAWAPPVAGPAPSPAAPRAPRRRLSPQQVLLGLGVGLLVAAALAFVAVGWTRFGLVFQAGTMLAVTAAAVAGSAAAARRGLRVTEEALAAGGALLVAVDLLGIRTTGLLGADAVGARPWTAVSCAVLLAGGALAARLTPTTLAWRVTAMLALQPLPVLLLPDRALEGAAVPAALLAVAVADLALAPRLGGPAGLLARVAAALTGLLGALAAVVLAWLGDPATSAAATAVLTAATLAAAGVHLLDPRTLVAAASRLCAPAAVAPSLALAGSLQLGDPVGTPLTGALGITALLGAVLLRSPARLASAAAGGTLVAVAGAVLLAADRPAALAALALALVLPAVAAARLLPALRTVATGTALTAPAAALLLAADADLPVPVAGLLLALLGATALAVAGLRTGRPEEWAAVAAGALAGVAAAATSADAGAWGQTGLQLAVVGAAGIGYAVVSGRRTVAVVAVADLVVATWTVLAGSEVATVEAYTLPAAAGLLALAAPQLRSGRSWAGWGPALLVGLVPSVLLVLGGGPTERLVLVTLAATAAVVVGAATHRQAPFVIGAASLAVVVAAQVAPYAPLLPRWSTLGTAGLALIAVGVTYERRRQQAREAVAWVAQMS